MIRMECELGERRYVLRQASGFASYSAKSSAYEIASLDKQDERIGNQILKQVQDDKK